MFLLLKIPSCYNLETVVATWTKTMSSTISPRVWSRFTVKKPDGSELKLRIQDLPRDRLEDALAFHMTYHTSEEIIQRSSGAYKSEEAFAEIRDAFGGMIMPKPTCKLSICCLDEDPEKEGDILGLSIMVLESKEESDKEIEEIGPMLKTPEVVKLMDVLHGMGEMYDVTETYGTAKPYYNDYGLSTHPEYRGLGIATQFLKVRRMICKEQGVGMTVAWMTSIGTQKAADRDEGSWKTVFEISSDEFQKQVGLPFENPPPSIKLMVAEIKV